MFETNSYEIGNENKNQKKNFDNTEKICINYLKLYCYVINNRIFLILEYNKSKSYM